MGNEVPQKLTTFFRLIGIFFTQNTSIISYFNKVGLLVFPFWTPHFVIWTPHFGWTPRLNYTVTHTVGEQVIKVSRRVALK